MKAKVQYNDIVGTAAADISDFVNNDMQAYLVQTYPSYDANRYKCRGYSFYVSQGMRASVEFICYDTQEKKFARLTPINKVISLENAFEMFKRFNIVLGKDIEEVNEDELIDVDLV